MISFSSTANHKYAEGSVWICRRLPIVPSDRFLEGCTCSAYLEREIRPALTSTITTLERVLLLSLKFLLKKKKKTTKHLFLTYFPFKISTLKSSFKCIWAKSSLINMAVFSTHRDLTLWDWTFSRRWMLLLASSDLLPSLYYHGSDRCLQQSSTLMDHVLRKTDQWGLSIYDLVWFCFPLRCFNPNL